jgi:hypothetical protein
MSEEFKMRMKFNCPHCGQYHLNIWFEREGITTVCFPVKCRGCGKEFTVVRNALECLYCTKRCEINSAGEFI